MKAGQLKERYNKIEEENIPAKKFKKWTAADKAWTTDLMREDVSIKDTLPGKARRDKINADNVRLLNIVKERGPEEIIQLLQGTSSLALM